jgi:cytochrome c551/c552
MKHSSQIGPVILALVFALWLSGSGCGKNSQPPRTEVTVAGAPAGTPDTTAARGDTSHATAVLAARPSHATTTHAEHLATNAPSKAPVASPTREPVAAPSPAPVPAPAPAATPPPAKPAESAGGLDAGPRAADVPVDPVLASKGKSLFNQRACNTCHLMAARLVGPPLGPVPRQRSAAWILAMIQRPAEMTRSDPIAKQLFQEYKVQMVLSRSVSGDEARALLEYIKSASK